MWLGGFAAVLAACAAVDAPAKPAPAAADAGRQQAVRGFAAAHAIDDGWWHAKFQGETEYLLVPLGRRVAIRAVGRDSASGLFRRVQVDPVRCPTLEWSWRVDRLQDAADLRTKQGDDVAASLFVLFGDPGMLSNPVPVPTIRYVWSNDRERPGSVIDNPYLPQVVRNIVVRAGAADAGRFVRERRDLVEDFAAAFGGRAVPQVEAVAIFTDNDQTRQPVTAFYEKAEFLCAREASTWRNDRGGTS